MEYRIMIRGGSKFYEATSFGKRETDSDSWVKLGRPEEGTLERAVVNAALEIAHERGKSRLRVIIKLD